MADGRSHVFELQPAAGGHLLAPRCCEMSADLLILGLGNPLMGDDGVGAAVVDLVVAAGNRPGVRAVAVPDVYALPETWTDEAEVWLVDAMVSHRAPGTIHHVGHDQILQLQQQQTSAHHLGLSEGLRWITHTFPKMSGVRFRLWGVEPQRVAPPEGLTDAVARAAWVVSREVLDALSDSRPNDCD